MDIASRRLRRIADREIVQRARQREEQEIAADLMEIERRVLAIEISNADISARVARAEAQMVALWAGIARLETISGEPMHGAKI